MDKEDELIERLDEQGNGTELPITREKAHAEGIPHRVIHGWILTQLAEKDHLIFQQRSSYKLSSPGKLDSSFAGHILYGDSPLDSFRECREELGFDVTIDHVVNSFEEKNIYIYSDYKDIEFATCFLFRHDIHINDIKFDPEEVKGVFLVPFEQIIHWKSIPDKVTGFFWDGESAYKQTRNKSDFIDRVQATNYFFHLGHMFMNSAKRKH